MPTPKKKNSYQLERKKTTDEVRREKVERNREKLNFTDEMDDRVPLYKQLLKQFPIEKRY
jgi:hypothetical protein